MQLRNNGFGPQNQKEERIYAQENFRIDVQMAIHELMDAKGVNQKELASRLGVSEARVSQFFGDDFNMTIRKLAGVFHALGEYPSVTVALKTVTNWALTAGSVVTHYDKICRIPWQGNVRLSTSLEIRRSVDIDCANVSADVGSRQPCALAA